MTTGIQRSMAAGEIAPALYARVDLVKFLTGLRTCRNNIVMRHGGTANRPGLQFIAELDDSTEKGKLFPFIFNTEQTYVLIFNSLTMRVIRNDAQLTETAKNITGATQANPCVITITSHGYSNGNEVFISGVGGMTELNNRNYKVANVTTNTFELQTMDSVNLNSTSFTAYTSGGTAAKIFEITHPFLEADLPNLQFSQSADVITFTNSGYEPRELSRTDHTSWTLNLATFNPDQTHPTAAAVASGGGSGNLVEYKVTAINDDDSEESLPGIQATINISGATQANPVVITTSASHGYSTGHTVLIDSIVGMTELNGRRFKVTNITATTFSLDDEDGTGHTAYSSGGTVGREDLVLASAGTPSSSNTHTVSWTAASGATQYAIYRSVNGVYSNIGIAEGTSFDDDGSVDPDTTDNPPQFREPFFGSSNYPATVTHHQQRRIFANTTNNPDKGFASRSGNFSNFTRSNPSQDDDSFDFFVRGEGGVNGIQHLMNVNGTFSSMTSVGEFLIQGNEAGLLVPFQTHPTQASNFGSSNIRPLNVGGNLLFIQARGGYIRDLLFSLETSGYRGNDLTVFSSHLFENKTISNWTYQQIPHSIVWSIRSDGELLGMTYLPEHELVGHHRHDTTNGTFEDSVTIPRGTEDKSYFIVKRTVKNQAGNDRTARYIEGLSSRIIDDVVDSVFVDSYLTYDGRNTDTTHTMTLSGGTDWTFEEDLTLTSSASYFSSSDVGNQIHITDSANVKVKCDIKSFTSATVVTIRSNKTVPTTLRSTATSNWGYAVDEITGLWHLEGRNVSAFADGYVAASVNNLPDFPDPVTVTNGIAQLDDFYTLIHGGEPITSDIETLDIDVTQAESLIDKAVSINNVALHLEKSRGIFIGGKPPSDDTTDPLEGLRLLQRRTDENLDDPPKLVTDILEAPVLANYKQRGRVFIRQVDPIPMSVLAVAPAGVIPIRG